MINKISRILLAIVFILPVYLFFISVVLLTFALVILFYVIYNIIFDFIFDGNLKSFIKDFKERAKRITNGFCDLLKAPVVFIKEIWSE